MTIAGNSNKFMSVGKIKKNFALYICLLMLVFSSGVTFSQVEIEAGDPGNNTDIRGFFKSRLGDVDEELNKVKKGKVKAIVISPGGRARYSVTYGEKNNLDSQANYNSAVAARNPDNFAKKIVEPNRSFFFWDRFMARK